MKRILPRIILWLVMTMIVWLAAATVIERVRGSEAAYTLAYHSWPFATLWAVIGVLGIALCFMLRLYRKPAAFAIHVAMLLILVGAALTWTTATNGELQLETGNTACSYEISDCSNIELPFSISLERFDMQCYAGTQTPSAFVAHVLFKSQNGSTERAEVSLNNIASFGGYRFCLKGYEQDGNGVALSVTHDLYGIAVTHFGYLLLLVAMIAHLLSRRTRYRQVIKRLNTKNAVMVLLFFALPSMAQAKPKVLPEDVADDFGKIYVMHSGRVCPFETMAREITTKLYGKPSYKGCNACQVVTGWWFFYDDWAKEPMIKVKSGEVRQILGVQSKYVSLNDFFDERHNYLLQESLVTPSKDVLEANEKCQVATALGLGSLFRVMPLRREGQLQWYAPGALDIPTDIEEEKWAFMKNGMNYFNELVISNNWDDCRTFIDKLYQFQQQEGGNLLPPKHRIQAELLYNRMEATLLCAILLVIVGLLYLIMSINKFEYRKRLLNIIVIVALVGSFLYLSLILALRWMASGHLPMSNGYETMQLMAWCALIFSLLLCRKSHFLAALGTLAAAFTLLVSYISGANPAITPLMPVLNSPWLCLHVAIIMLAYALLAVLTLNSIVALLLRKKLEIVERLQITAQAVLLPAVFCLAAGIFIGAVWAGVSWGSYWSWDPKETWALITLLIYAMPLHDNSLPRFKQPLFLHTYIVLAFLCVIITYWGVNNLLGGMHSYA